VAILSMVISNRALILDASLSWLAFFYAIWCV